MSANNQTLIKKHEGKYYVFENVMAETWVHYDHKTETFDENRINELTLAESAKSFDTVEEAIDFAVELENEDETEYGWELETLVKDGAEVNIINPTP